MEIYSNSEPFRTADRGALFITTFMVKSEENQYVSRRIFHMVNTKIQVNFPPVSTRFGPATPSLSELDFPHNPELPSSFEDALHAFERRLSA